MNRLDSAADTLLTIALSMYARAPKGTTAQALDGLRDSLVAELGCSKSAGRRRGTRLDAAPRGPQPQSSDAGPGRRGAAVIGAIVATFGYLLGWYRFPDSPPRAALVCVAVGVPVMAACYYLGIWF